MDSDLSEYQKSISKELLATKNRIRHLIGDSHWLTDGEHKEAILRSVLQRHLPENRRIGTGFICYPNEVEGKWSSSTQLDILITDTSKPTIFKDGELTIVTPDAVEAIIEVKTKLTSKDIEEVLTKLADQVEKARRTSGNNINIENDKHWAGLFVFDATPPVPKHQTLMQALVKATNNRPARAINCIAFGEKIFIRFWPEKHNASLGKWHSYEIPDMAFGYFVSNLASHVSEGIPYNAEFAWYPLKGGKESKRVWYGTLGGTIQKF